MSVRALILISLLAACSTPVALYCETDSDCADNVGLPFCDVNGQYEASGFVGKTCIAYPWDAGLDVADAGLDASIQPGEPDAAFCTADAFLRCDDADTAVYCNSDGSAEAALDCDLSCDTEAGGCACEPSTSTCVGDTTFHCSAAGQVDASDACPLGCHSSGVRCTDVAPSNGLAEYLDQTDRAPVLDLVGTATFNTDSGTVLLDGSQVLVPSELLAAPVGGVAVRVYMVKSLSMETATFAGSAAAAIVSDGDIVIRGVVTATSGQLASCQAGGGQSVDPNAGVTGDEAFTGAGGGGFGTAGAIGGSALGTTGGTAGGMSGSSSLVPLRGGCSGGGSSTRGLGGGALQLVSRSKIEFETGDVPGVISAPGTGGGRSDVSILTNQGGRGGGSGGAILLEAPSISIPADHGLAANGGGGAGYCDNSRGQSGQPSEAFATGGSCTGAGQGDGGRGAGGGFSPLAGENNTTGGSGRGGGGGGGGFGRIRINTAAGGLVVNGDAILSPAPSTGSLGTR